MHCCESNSIFRFSTNQIKFKYQTLILEIYLSETLEIPISNETELKNIQGF